MVESSNKDSETGLSADTPIVPPETGGRRKRRRRRLSITTVLTFGFGGLTLIGVALVLGIGLWTAGSNTVQLLGDTAELSTAALEEEVRRALDPVREGNEHIARLVAAGEIDPDDTLRFVDFMAASMASTPQILGRGIIRPDGTMLRLGRNNPNLGVELVDWTRLPPVRRLMAEAPTKKGAYWGPPVRTPSVPDTLINNQIPLFRDGEFLGVLTAVVTVGQMSRYLARSKALTDPPDRFVLYGKTHVLAHASMGSGNYSIDEAIPLPRVGQIGDPVLAQMWTARQRERLFIQPGGGTDGHVIVLGDRNYPFFYRVLEGYGDRPLYVGSYITPGSVLGIELRRVVMAAIVGFVVLILAVGISVFFGRRMSRPIRVLGNAAQHVADLDFSHVPHIPRSRLRELDEAGSAFTTMIVGLKWFENYVPKKLVRYIVERAGDDGIPSEERQVTVMFTDIVAFTAMAETLDASEVADLLNDHFSILGKCIEAAGGTIDKYIGDSVMAFWGPPLGDEDHVSHACRAARDIRTAIHADNERRAARNLPPIRLRIGMHSGPVIVGNIGAPGRINYTLIGDTVNLAQRLEQLCKSLGEEDDAVSILISGDVAERLNDPSLLKPKGIQRIRGRQGELDVYLLS